MFLSFLDMEIVLCQYLASKETSLKILPAKSLRDIHKMTKTLAHVAEKTTPAAKNDKKDTKDEVLTLSHRKFNV